MEATLTIKEITVELNEVAFDSSLAPALRELTALELVLVGGGNTTATYI
jgi:hypothetical protein